MSYTFKKILNSIALLSLLCPTALASANHHNHYHYNHTKVSRYHHKHYSHYLRHINKEYHYAYSKQTHKHHILRNDLINPSFKNYQGVNDRHAHTYIMPHLEHIANLPINIPQSLSMSPDGHHAYICDMDKATNGFDKIINYNIPHHKIENVGRWHFYGHGQSITHYKDHMLIAVAKTYNNDSQYAGSMHRGEIIKISTKTLNPISRHYIKFTVHKSNIGDALAYDGSHLYEDNRILISHNKHVPNSTVILYQMHLTPNHVKFYKYNQGIYPTLGYFVQGMAYNPRNKRMYIEESKPNRLISFPLKQLQHNHLHTHDIHVIKINQHREPEGIAFDAKGHGYIVLGHPYQASLYRISHELP